MIYYCVFENLSGRLWHLYKEGIFPNLELHTANTSLFVHKAIVHTRCPKLVEALSILQRYPDQLSEKVVQYLYTNDVDLSTINTFGIVDVLYLAHSLDLPHLAYLCKEYLFSSMDRGLFFSLLVQALFYMLFPG